MRHMRTPALLSMVAVLGVASVSLPLRAQEGFRFRSGVDLVNVTVTVTDSNGRFVSDLRKEDFAVYDDGERQEITHFSSERVPVSLGILMDVSGSMTAEKMRAARAAIDRFVVDLLGEDDEIFFMEFADRAHLVQDWTTDRSRIRQAVSRARPAGGTALYDAVRAALPIAAYGRHQKKALLVLSDGNDTDSSIAGGELRQAIRESEVLVYALGVDSRAPSRRILTQPPIRRPPPSEPPFPLPIPRPGTRRPPGFPQLLGLPQLLGGARPQASSGERVDADALRRITDETGGRTEIIREFDDLEDATARIADELSQQYALAYQSPRRRDGEWHTIRVEIERRGLTVRARRSYLAS